MDKLYFEVIGILELGAEGSQHQVGKLQLINCLTIVLYCITRLNNEHIEICSQFVINLFHRSCLVEICSTQRDAHCMISFIHRTNYSLAIICGILEIGNLLML